RRGVQSAGDGDAAGERDVELVLGEAAGEGTLVRGGDGLFVLLRQRFLDPVRFLAVSLAVGRRHLADATQGQDDLALFAEVFLVPGARGGLVGGGGRFGDGVLFEGGEIVGRRGGHEQAYQPGCE